MVTQLSGQDEGDPFMPRDTHPLWSCCDFWPNLGWCHLLLRALLTIPSFSMTACSTQREQVSHKARPASSHLQFTSAEQSSDSEQEERKIVGALLLFWFFPPHLFHPVPFCLAPYLIYDPDTVIYIYYVSPPSYTKEKRNPVN